MDEQRGGVGIIGLGKFIPARALDNAEIEAQSGIEPGTIEKQTGITRRFLVDEGGSATEIAVAASRRALDAAGVDPKQIGLVLGCTFTPDYVFPALACDVHRALGTTGAGAFDLMANCTAFQVGAMVASDRMLADPSIENALVIGTAIVSRHIRWDDPNSAIYFGDGAGAAVLGRVPPGYGFLAHEVSSQTRAYESVRLRRGANENGERRAIEMNGMDVWKQVAQHQPGSVRRAVEKAGLTLRDVDFYIFHQANLHLITYLMSRLGARPERTYTNVERIGNTAEASIPIALTEAVEQKKIAHGDVVVLSGVGAGFTFGASVLRWYDPRVAASE
ncbi:MAG: ketoacyl-ACP synthase III [Candidatus Eremiobacteraeota bacterium]|nr:ketoacyl-ACP synthase III [Candidatus Eremiobacteraeota bacterium]